jgi:Na+(H+)/acetate symporter ActP
LAGLFWRRLTEKATYWAMVWGFIVYAALIFCEKEFFPKTFFKVMILPSLVWGMIVAAVLIIIISYKTTNPPEQQKIWDDLHAKMFPKERAHATAANYVWNLAPAVIFVVFLVWFLSKVIGTY